MEIREYLDKWNLPYKPVNRPNGIEYVMNCPFCGDTEHKFSVNSESGAYNCLHKNTCNAHGSFYELQKKFEDNPIPRRTSYDFKRAKVPVYEKPIVNPHALGPDIKGWLKERKISDKTIKKFRLGQKDNKTLMVPYYKQEILVNVKYRVIPKEKFWNTNGGEPVLLNRDNIKKNGEGIWELIIVEGEMDCLAMDTYGIPTVSVPNGTGDSRWLETEWEWLKKFEKIYIMMDMDSSGEDYTLKLIKRLGQERCYEVELPYKDANECLLNGISADEMLRQIDGAKGFELDSVKTYEDYVERLHYRLDHPELRYGVPTPFIKLTEMLSGFREKELTVLGGNNHAGKSTWLNQVVLHLMKQTFSVFMTSIEMDPEFYLEWAIKQSQGSFTHKTIENFKLEVLERFFIMDTVKSVTPEALLETWSFVAKKYGVKYFVLDSLMKIQLTPGDQYNKQSVFVSQLVDFAKEFSCHVFLVAHVRKPDKDSYSSGKVDIAGSADITNLAHNVIMLQRLEPEEREAMKANGAIFVPSTYLKLKKCRVTGEMGRIDLGFNINTKRFEEM